MHCKRNFFECCFDPDNGTTIFSIIIGVFYFLIPLAVSIVLPEVKMFDQLAMVAAASIFFVWLGSKTPLCDERFRQDAVRIGVSVTLFIAAVWIFFIFFIVITFSTAPAIPVISALSGVDANELSQQRGDFLKGREGVGQVLLYLSTFMNTLIPYTIILMYAAKHRFRHSGAIFFFLYAVSFMQKALFLNLILPLLAFLAMQKRLNAKYVAYFLGGSIFLLVMLTYLSHSGAEEPQVSGGFFTAVYAPSDPVDYFLWRSFAVPIFTAADSLLVHAEQFGGQLLMGATSSFIAGVAGIERINLERFVFEHQFGSWNEIANSNAVFFVDAYVNFGWIGVGIFGFIVGQIFRWFRKSDDFAFKSQWPIFAFILFSAPLLGMLLSNGWLFMVFHALFIRVSNHDANHKTRS